MKKVSFLFFLVLLLLSALLAPAAQGANTRIVGGNEAAPGSWPSQAALNIDVGWDTYLCGGTVIHPRWIITAAHCTIDADDVRVVLGSNNRNSPAVTSKRYINYPSYDDWTAFGDLALVELAEPTTQPAAEIATAADTSLFQTGAPAYIAGWGTTCYDDPACPVQTMLREAEISISDYALCQNNYQEAGEPISANTVCAGAPGRDSCQGDSGGPLMIDNYEGDTPTRLLLGVVSWGIGCAEADYPGIYTDLTKYRSWIGSYVSYLSGPSSKSWGQVKLKRNVAKTLTFTNSGILPLPVTRVTQSGSSRFQIRNTTCKTTLSVGASCTVRVAFRPKEKKKKTARVILKNNSKTLKGVSLAGRGR